MHDLSKYALGNSKNLSSLYLHSVQQRLQQQHPLYDAKYSTKTLFHICYCKSVDVPALPPFRRISNPASVARGWDEATTPFVPYTCDRRLENRWSTSSGWSIFFQSMPRLSVDMFLEVLTLGRLNQELKKSWNFRSFSFSLLISKQQITYEWAQIFGWIVRARCTWPFSRAIKIWKLVIIISLQPGGVRPHAHDIISFILSIVILCPGVWESDVSRRMPTGKRSVR